MNADMPEGPAGEWDDADANEFDIEFGEEAISADVVNVTQSSAESVEAEEVHLRQSAAQTIDADTVDMTWSAAQVVEAETVNMDQSAVLSIRAESANLGQGASAGVIMGQEVSLENSAAVAVIGQHQVNASGVRTVLLIAREVSGDVRALLDPRGALFFGLGIGGVLGLLSLLRPFRRRR